MELLTDLLTQIKGLTGYSLVAVVLIALGYALKMIPRFPNQFIPAATMLAGMILTPLLTSPGEMAPNLRNPIVGQVVHGFLIACVAWILHDKLLKGIIDRYLPKPETKDETKPDPAPPPAGPPAV